MGSLSGKQLIQEMVDDGTDTVISRLEHGVQIVFPLQVQLIQKSLPLHADFYSEDFSFLVRLGTAVILFQFVDFIVYLKSVSVRR